MERIHGFNLEAIDELLPKQFTDAPIDEPIIEHLMEIIIMFKAVVHHYDDPSELYHGREAADTGVLLLATTARLMAELTRRGHFLDEYIK